MYSFTRNTNMQDKTYTQSCILLLNMSDTAADTDAVDARRGRLLARMQARHGDVQRPCERDAAAIDAAGVVGRS